MSQWLLHTEYRMSGSTGYLLPHMSSRRCKQGAPDWCAPSEWPCNVNKYMNVIFRNYNCRSLVAHLQLRSLGAAWISFWTEFWFYFRLLLFFIARSILTHNVGRDTVPSRPKLCRTLDRQTCTRTHLSPCSSSCVTEVCDARVPCSCWRGVGESGEWEGLWRTRWPSTQLNLCL